MPCNEPQNLSYDTHTFSSISTLVNFSIQVQLGALQVKSALRVQNEQFLEEKGFILHYTDKEV